MPVTSPLTRWAALVAGFMLAHQVAAKAVRDSFFLTVFPATSLPSMVMAAAVVSIAAVPIYSRLLARYGPNRLVPAGFLLSAAAHVVEWTQPALTPVLTIVIYLHLAGLGALLLSGFWSLAAETFDPITARRQYGRIAAAGTLGGIAGGAAAERLAAWLPPSSLLLFLATLHAVCGVILVLRRVDAARRGEEDDAPAPTLGLGALRLAPQLKPLALLVLLGTASAAVLDYIFKAQAADHYDGGDLLRYLAMFYAVTQTLTFLAQTFITNRALTRRGIGDTVSTLPLGVGLGSIAALFVPALPLFATARGLELVIRGSLFRSSYELLFTPMGPVAKRRAKAFLDVACDRAGDAVGAGMVQLALAIAPAFLVSSLLGVVLGMAAVALWASRRLNTFYARQVERRLVDHAEHTFDDADVTGWATRPLVPPISGHAPEATPRPADPPILDASTRLFLTLRSGNRAEVIRALAAGGPFEAAHVAHIITLLAWDDVRDDAQAALIKAGPTHTGLLVDHLLAPDVAFAVRRRLPPVLAHLPSPRALDGLLAGLDDARFEVRYRCSRAIDAIVADRPDLPIDRARVFAAIARELAVPLSVATSYTVIDGDDPADSADRHGFVGPNVDYVFSLLAAVLPREPLKAAHRAVSSDDRLLRGLALDYLDGVLPDDLRGPFRAILDIDAAHARPAQAVTASDDDARGQSDSPRRTTPASDPH
ncbi:MAG: hypothetical protein ABS36_01410 [Acidobacteria bacterium SCN 69-37]|nr:MAG: hypothetical protein ABS36_01410 [Acidobacteria bacterium SCN 69-37]